MIDQQKLLSDFGRKLRALRLSKNLSQEQLGSLSGLHPTFISQTERGKRNITLISLYKISSGYGCQYLKC